MVQVMVRQTVAKTNSSDPHRSDPLLELLHVELLRLFRVPPLGLLLGGRGRAALAGVLRHGVLLNWSGNGSARTTRPKAGTPLKPTGIQPCPILKPAGVRASLH